MIIWITIPYIYYSDNILIPYHRYITMNICHLPRFLWIPMTSSEAEAPMPLFEMVFWGSTGNGFWLPWAMGIPQSWSWISMGMYFHTMGSYEIILGLYIYMLYILLYNNYIYNIIYIIYITLYIYIIFYWYIHIAFQIQYMTTKKYQKMRMYFTLQVQYLAPERHVCQP